jgi:Zn-dependent protease
MDEILFFKTFGLIILIFSIVVHEISHGLGALACGDDTAYRQGRITLNPIKHIDMLGSIIVPILCILLPGSLLFGWAKPVPVDVTRMRNPRKGLFISVFAGPASNLILAGVAALLFRGIPHVFPGNAGFLESFYGGSGLGALLVIVVLTNLSLALFNLIPVPPLDGSKILYSLLPPNAAYKFIDFYERFGVALIIVVIFYAGSILGGAIRFLAQLFLGW